MKEADLFLQNKAMNGDKEHLSQVSNLSSCLHLWFFELNNLFCRDYQVVFSDSHLVLFLFIVTRLMLVNICLNPSCFFLVKNNLSSIYIYSVEKERLLVITVMYNCDIYLWLQMISGISIDCAPRHCKDIIGLDDYVFYRSVYNICILYTHTLIHFLC